MDEIGDIKNTICEADIAKPEQISILYDVLDWLINDFERASKEERLIDLDEERQMQPYQRALMTFGRHVMAERRAAKDAATDLRTRLEA